MLLTIFMYPGHVVPQLTYLASFKFSTVFQYFKAVSKSVPSFYWMKNVLLVPHKIYHCLRAVIISSFLLGIREQTDLTDNTFLHKLNIPSYIV